MNTYTPEHATPRAQTIFGREPAAWVGLIEGIVALLTVFALGVTSTSGALIIALAAAAAGAYTAWATRDTMLAAVLAVVKALLALVVYYGLELTLEQQAAVLGFVPIALGLWQRTQTSPVADPVDPSPQQVVPVAPPSGVPAVSEPTVSSSGVEYPDQPPSMGHPYDG